MYWWGGCGRRETRLSFEEEDIVKAFQAALPLMLLVSFFFICFFIWQASHRLWLQNGSNEQIVCIYQWLEGLILKAVTLSRSRGVYNSNECSTRHWQFTDGGGGKEPPAWGKIERKTFFFKFHKYTLIIT